PAAMPLYDSSQRLPRSEASRSARAGLSAPSSTLILSPIPQRREPDMNAPHPTPYRNYVAGDWRPAQATLRNLNPSARSAVIGEYAEGTAADAADAVAAAKAALPGWAGATIQQRCDCLEKAGNEILARKEELGRLLSREEGKTLAEGIGEATRAGQIFKWFA